MRNMEQENKKLQETAEEIEDSFLSRVINFFQKLMVKFTKGKYSTPEEQAFFSDEKNLYDENGRLTPQYQKKIKEYEEYVKSQNVDEFLHEVHSKDSEEFGPAYDENEMAIMDNSNAFISEQEQIEKDLEESKDFAARKRESFDLDAWLLDYLKQYGICDDVDEAYGKIRDMILDELEKLDKEMKDIEENDIYRISRKINIKEIYQNTINEVLNQKEE